MSDIVLLDTSIYLNVLDVPQFNQDRETVFSEFEKCIKVNSSFLLPMATIWETGNHIADISKGAVRKRLAERLVDNVAKAMSGIVPYRMTYFPERETFLAWMHDFPLYVNRTKSPKKREGVSLSDLSIIKEWERTCELNPTRRVRIWALDSHLAGYDRNV